MTSNICRICSSSYTSNYTFREMMFGMRDEFAYGQCPDCNCIQIMEVPQDIEKYYPPYYVSFAQEVPALKRQPFLKRMIKNMRMKKKYAQSNAPLLAYLKPTAIMPGQKVLDIGCGKGALICQLFNLGFEQVTGVDKFISQETDYGYGVKVLKKDLSELPSNYYSLLIMHHVLEHVDNQAEQLKECYRLLKKGGALLISLPVVGTALRYIKKTGCR